MGNMVMLALSFVSTLVRGLFRSLGIYPTKCEESPQENLLHIMSIIDTPERIKISDPYSISKLSSLFMLQKEKQQNCTTLFSLQDNNVSSNNIHKTNLESTKLHMLSLHIPSNSCNYFTLEQECTTWEANVQDVHLVDHYVAKLFDIIKKLCAKIIDLQPEIPDTVFQVLIEHLIMSCNGQYGISCTGYYNTSCKVHNGWLIIFISDINTLQKFTSDICLKLKKYTIKDFMNMIYQCYCTLRHDSKHEKDNKIAEFKEYFSFITSMEAKKEMKKLKALTNFLLMLTILLIASGGHHKSAKLKKYLSLKYEYRDSILYLLWCSGDVEINPGPTCSTLRMLDDSEKERNWIYDMCSMLVKLIKKKSFDKKNGGMWKEKPLRWPTDCPFYNPRNKPKGLGYSIEMDKKLLDCLEKYCNVEGIFKATTQFDDEQTTFKVKQYHKEIIAWKKQRSELFELYILRKELDTLIATTQFADEQTTFKVKQYQNKIIAWKKHRSELFEQYILRQELDTLIAAKGCLHKYRNDLKFNLCLFDNHTMHTEVFCNYGEDSNGCKKSYTDIVRDIATTFCRIGNRLNYLEKSPGIWKTPPKRWNPSHPYYSPCNDKKGRNTKQDNELVGNLLTYCESNNIIIPSELQPLIKPWEDKNTLEITKYYTIWSNTAIIKHSLTYLELEGLLGKIHVQESLKQIGVVIDTQCWRCPSITNSSTSDKFDKSQNSGYSDNIHSPPSSDQETNTNSIPQVASLQINSANPFMQQPNSTQINLNDTPTSPHSIVGLTDGHLCNIASEQQNQWNQSSKKRHRRNNDESCSEPKLLHVSEEDIALFLKVFPSSSENGKDLSITTSKGNSKNSNITTLLPDDLSHDLISIKSIPHHLPLEKQTDQLVINKLPDTADDKPVDSSSCKQAENANKKGETTLDQSVNQILIPFEEQDYSLVVGDSSIPNTSNTTDQQSDFSNELPVYVELYINRIENRSNATLEKDIEQFINLKEQDIDLS